MREEDVYAAQRLGVWLVFCCIPATSLLNIMGMDKSFIDFDLSRSIILSALRLGTAKALALI